MDLALLVPLPASLISVSVRVSQAFFISILVINFIFAAAVFSKKLHARDIQCTFGTPSCCLRKKGCLCRCICRVVVDLFSFLMIPLAWINALIGLLLFLALSWSSFFSLSVVTMCDASPSVVDVYLEQVPPSRHGDVSSRRTLANDRPLLLCYRPLAPQTCDRCKTLSLSQTRRSTR